MNFVTVSPSSAETDPDADQVVDPAPRQLMLLRELGDLGMEVARALQRRALAQIAADEAPADPGLPLQRMARMVRQTFLLEQKSFDGYQDRQAARQDAEAAADALAEQEAEEAAQREEKQAEIAAERHRQWREDQIADVIQRTMREDDEAEGLDDETIEGRWIDLCNRLYDEENDEFLGSGDRPIGVIIAEICGEAGIEPDWDRWRLQSWAMDEAEADTPGSPYSQAAIDAREAKAETGDPPEAGTGPPG